MKIAFRNALRSERNALAAFDRRVFSKSDAFDAEDWAGLDAYWMMIDGQRAGCCAFERDAHFANVSTGEIAKCSGSLYIVSTGILPEYQGMGLGDRFKQWQIAWARTHGFDRIVTNCRRSNRAIIRLNRKHGFEVIGLTRGNYYWQPAEPAVMMELKFPQKPPALDEIIAFLIAKRASVERAIAALSEEQP
jgi:GNAT superfamily N-acetyltransferase